MIPRRGLLGIGALSACAGLALVGWRVLRPAATLPVPAPPGLPAQVHKARTGDLDQVLAFMARGGSPLELAQAIEKLDTITRLSRTIPEDQHADLLSAMEHGAPESMDEGAWSHLFNCACNALAVGQTAPDEKLIALLERIAVDDPRLVIRLYALQHLGVRYETATADCRERLRALVLELLAKPDAQTAGTALVLWRRWENSAEPGSISSLEMSRAMAADATRPVDVRVTALHAIGEDPGVLNLARSIAVDMSQPVILRKAALNLMGRHGGAEDLAALRQCGRESPRLAQATEPAAMALEERLVGKPQTALIPVP